MALNKQLKKTKSPRDREENKKPLAKDRKWKAENKTESEHLD